MWDDGPRYGHQQGTYMDYDSFDSQNDAHMHDPEHTYGGIRQLVQTSATSARDHVNANPYATLHTINRELMELGLPSPLQLPAQPEYLEDNQRVVECLVALLQQRKRDVGFREAMDDELRKAMGEEDVLRATVARLERELDAAQREAAMNRVHWQEAERLQGEGEAARKKLAAELRTTRSNAAMVKAQFVNDGRKRELEAAKLKDRLQKLITDKHRTCKVNVELTNPLRTGRAGDAVARGEKLMDDLLRRYNAREGELVARVEELEDLVRQLDLALAQLCSEVGVDADESGDAPTRALALVDRVRAGYQRAVAAKPAAVDPAEITRRDRQITALEGEIVALRGELEEMRGVVEEQKRVVEMAASRAFREPMAETPPPAADHEALRRERRQLEEERQRFTHAAIELGNERGELQRERLEFEARKTARGTAELLDALPPTPQWMRGLDQAQATPLLLNQLQSMLQGTPTNQLLASMMLAATPQPAARQPEEEFPDIDTNRLLSPTGTAPSATAARSARSSSSLAPTPGKVPARTPVDVRSARAPRVCTRPGCAAHAPHSHDDATPAMELKPPVPRFRRPESSSSPASRSPSRQEQPAPRLLQRRPPPPATASRASANAPTSSRSHAANIFK
ncbi:hypothetical protein FBU31_004237 [Coemansia sp. 'formosensis']|nr:hypothetical protein FBU31_004237 [Coemansia sp. 'formosensis']